MRRSFHRARRAPQGKLWRVRAAARAPVLVVALAGCAPALPELVADNHFDEALCAVSYFDRAEWLPELLGALRDEFDVAIHVEALPAEQVEALAPKAAQGLRTRGTLVRVRTDTRYSASLTAPEIGVMVARGTTAVGMRPLSLEGLAWLTGEDLPGARTVHWGPSGLQEAMDAAQAMGAAGSHLLDVVTLGAWRLTPFHVSEPPSRPSGESTIEPTPAELAAAAPQASALLGALRQADAQTLLGTVGATMTAAGVTLRPGEKESFYAIWPLGASGSSRADALLVTLSYSGHAEEGPCRLVESSRLPLGSAASLELQLREQFGERMRRLSELRRAAGAQTMVEAPGVLPAAPDPLAKRPPEP